jgi:hypothetical protein
MMMLLLLVVKSIIDGRRWILVFEIHGITLSPSRHQFGVA